MLRYKRVTTCPPVVLNPDIVSNQKNYWKFYWMRKKQNIKIIQLGEFTVGMGMFANMAWSKCGESLYGLQSKKASRFSVIAANCDSNLELVAISSSNTNEKVFHEFVRLLSKKINIKYGELKDKLVITFDGARYHWVDSVEQYWKNVGLMVIQTPAYITQFSPVEIFINWVKNKIRKKLRKDK